MKKIIYILIFLISASMMLQATVPTTFSIQGKLNGLDDKPVANGKYNITFNIYYDENASRPDWYITLPEVLLTNGLFNVVLDTKTFGANKLYLDIDKPWFLGIQLKDDQELKPRLRIGTVPYSQKSSNSDTANTVKGGAPVGTVLSYAGTIASIPVDYKVCDGTALVSTDYPALFAAIGKAWGDGSDDTDAKTNFNLPDLRGIFLRGVDETSVTDADAGARYAPKNGANSGAKVGSLQNDQSSAGNNIDQVLGGSPSFETSAQPVVNNFNSTYTTSNSLETRPMNASVYYIIRIK